MHTQFKLSIDPRSYHVFEWQDAFLLHDRSTGGTFELSPLAFAVLALIETGKTVENAIQLCCVKEPEKNAALESLIEMKERGLFVYAHVDRNIQSNLIAALMTHHPRRVQLLMAQGCNLGCRYCYAWRNGSNQKHTLMSWRIAKASVDYLVRRSGSRADLQITFFGGEPLLNWPMIKRVVAYCENDVWRKTGKRVSFDITTNATLLSSEIIDYMVAKNFGMMISIDGWKEMQDYNRPPLDADPDSYACIVSNALSAQEAYIAKGKRPPLIRANLTCKYPDGIKVRNYLWSIGFKRVNIAPIAPLPHGDDSPSSLSEDQMDIRLNASIVERRDTLSKLISGEEIDYRQRQILSDGIKPLEYQALKGLVCGTGRNTQVIDNKGKIYPCHRYEGMENYIIGDVFDGLDHAKTLEYYNKISEKTLARCHSCWIRDYCGGGCAWEYSAKNGEIHDPTERECDRRRKGVESLIGIRSEIQRSIPELLNTAAREEIEHWSWSKKGKGESECGVSCSKCS